jgi:hypothetical protein
VKWLEVIESLESTVKGAEKMAKLTDDADFRMEARIVSGVVAAIAVALRQGLEGGRG